MPPVPPAPTARTPLPSTLAAGAFTITAKTGLRDGKRTREQES